MDLARGGAALNMMRVKKFINWAVKRTAAEHDKDKEIADWSLRRLQLTIKGRDDDDHSNEEDSEEHEQDTWVNGLAGVITVAASKTTRYLWSTV